MARRGREAALKRAREKSRQEKQEAKREKRLVRLPRGDASAAVDENALLEEFAQLSARYESSQMSEENYNLERQRIFAALGIEAPDD